MYIVREPVRGRDLDIWRVQSRHVWTVLGHVETQEGDGIEKRGEPGVTARRPKNTESR